MGYDHGRFIWHELISEDHEGAKGFYGELFGWKFEEMDMGPAGTYLLAKVGDAPIGGFSAPPMEGVPPHWVGYLSVDDVDAKAKAIVDAGGTALMDAFDVPGVGRMQPVKDPQGAAFFLMKAEEGDGEAQSGTGHWHWDELWAKDGAGAVKHYSHVLGYEVETMEMPGFGDYHILKTGEHMRGGVMDAPEGVPPHWAFYVQVDDVDATVAKAKKLGGEQVGELMDVEGVGRFGFVKDREGSTLGVITPSSKG